MTLKLRVVNSRPSEGNHVFECQKKKSNLHYFSGITPKRVTSSGAQLRGLACGQETPQRWQTVGDSVSDLTDPVIEPKTST